MHTTEQLVAEDIVHHCAVAATLLLTAAYLDSAFEQCVTL